MRMRKKKHTDERINACAGYIYDKNTVGTLENKNFELEIGCGKGDFICETAQKFPGVNFVAVEKISDVAVLAIEKAKSLNIQNVKFLVANAKNLPEFFPEDSVCMIYLNFSDPWHKRYQQNNRLTSPAFLEIYKKFMKPNAEIILKTDNADLFEYSLKTLPANGFEISRKTNDLYNGEIFDLSENVQTEYEKKFVAQNVKICKLTAVLTRIL